MHMLQLEPGMASQAGNIYVEEAQYYKQKENPEHEFILFVVGDKTDSGLRNCIALDRNVVVPTSGVLRLVSSTTSTTHAADFFHVSHNGDVDSLKRSCLRPKSTCDLIERLFFTDRSFTLNQLIILASTTSHHQPNYTLEAYNCYWFSSAIWDGILKLSESSNIHPVIAWPNRRGKFRSVTLPRRFELEPLLNEYRSNHDAFMNVLAAELRTPEKEPVARPQGPYNTTDRSREEDPDNPRREEEYPVTHTSRLTDGTTNSPRGEENEIGEGIDSNSIIMRDMGLDFSFFTMMLHAITQTPAFITSLDREFERGRVHSAPAPNYGREVTNARQDGSCAPVHTCDITRDQLRELRDLVCSGEVLTCKDLHEYDCAVFTGNLLYALKRPCVVVKTDKPEELGSTVRFARRYNIQLTIKNGGHSYAGFSLNCGGILVFMNNGEFRPKGIKVDLESTPKTVTIPAGCLWEDVHKHFREHGYNEMAIGGRCPTVGVSGFTLGGGVSPFSRGYGLGIDTVLKMNIVTASGDCLEVNHNDTDAKKKDLFWALRGGGGGNFGILTGFTARLHDLAHNDGMVAYGLLTWELHVPEQRAKFEEMMEVYNSTSWPKELALDVIWQHTDVDKKPKLIAQVIVIYDGTLEECLEKIKTLTRYALSINIDLKKWYDVVVIEQGHGPEGPAYSHYASLIFEEGAMNNKVVSGISEFMDEARKFLDENDPCGKAHLLWVHIGEETAKIGANDTAFPWRNGTYVCYFKLQWTLPGVAEKMFDFVGKVKEFLVPHTIQGKAAYVNFVDQTIPNWQDAYYGDNYSRLQQVKKDWDPDNFFKFEQSIELPGLNGSRASTGESDVKGTQVDWDQYSLPEPEKLWNMAEPSKQKVLRAIREQAAPCGGCCTKAQA